MWMRKSASLVFAAAVGSLIALMITAKRAPSPAHADQGAPAARGASGSSAKGTPPTTAPPTQATPGQQAYPAQPGQLVVPVAGAPTSFVELVKRAMPSVVNIHSTALIRQRPMAVFPFGEDSPFYRLVQPPDQRAQSLG